MLLEPGLTSPRGRNAPLANGDLENLAMEYGEPRGAATRGLTVVAGVSSRGAALLFITWKQREPTKIQINAFTEIWVELRFQLTVQTD